MLLQFSVTNHRSIKDTAIISLKASTDKSLVDCLISPDEKKQLVPVLALYGANAAGKSNVLHALLLMREMVCGRYAKLLKGEPLPQEPFAFTDQPTQPTSFEAIYFYGGIKYAYGFSFDKSKVLTEYLYHWPNGREALIFSRENNGYQFRENIQEQFTLAGRTAENRLYLSSSNEWNCPQTEKAYLWFFEKLIGFVGTEMRLDVALSAIRQGGAEKSRILHEMLYADLGIKDIRITGSKEEPIISALHTLDTEDGTSKGFWLPLGQESVGTQRFFSRIGMWLAALESGAVLVVDEIESSMHPLLTRHLIEIMQDAAINTNHTQLIFTTHDTGLLDLTLLRRDQIWFAEKDEKTMNKYLKDISMELKYMEYAPKVFISAMTGQRINRMLELIQTVYHNHALRISTGVLNEVLIEATAMQQPPADKGRQLRLYYMTQVSVKPPTFVIFVNERGLFHFSYRRYIENQLREAFGFVGTPIHFIVREKGEKD